MSGEELNKKLKNAGIVLADVARQLGVPPQSINQTLNAKDIKSGFIEDLCRVLDKDISFFYGGEASTSGKDVSRLLDQIHTLEGEIKRLKDELRMKEDPEQPTKESEVYRLWMKQMEITERMQELYKSQKEK